MKLTALDVHQKEFSHSMRGYREDEVDDFLDKAAAEIDRLSKENETYIARIREIEIKLQGLEADRGAINSALLMAQRTADDLLSDAEAARSSMISEAKEAAHKITRDAEANKRDLLHELKRLKTEEERFRKNYARLLEDSMRAVSEVRLSESVLEALRDKSDSYAAAVARANDVVEPAPFVETKAEELELEEVPEFTLDAIEDLPYDETFDQATDDVEEIVVYASEEEILTTDPDFAANAYGDTLPPAAPVSEPAAETEFAFKKEPEVEVAPEPVAEPESTLSASSPYYVAPAPAPAPAADYDVEPKKESFTQGLIMGEVGDQGPVDLAFQNPRDFEIPGGDRWGDREDDIDIEEID